MRIPPRLRGRGRTRSERRMSSYLVLWRHQIWTYAINPSEYISCHPKFPMLPYPLIGPCRNFRYFTLLLEYNKHLNFYLFYYQNMREKMASHTRKLSTRTSSVEEAGPPPSAPAIPSSRSEETTMSMLVSFGGLVSIGDTSCQRGSGEGRGTRR